MILMSKEVYSKLQYSTVLLQRYLLKDCVLQCILFKFFNDKNFI